MNRIALLAMFVIAAAFSASCGNADQDERSGTESLTRSLLSQPNPDGSGPSTRIEWGAELPPEEEEIGIPDLGYNFGSPDAPVKILELSDFGCGFCRRFHEESFATLHAEFIESEQLEWKFMPFITGMFENSLAVTEAAECALEQGPAYFEAFSDRLWEEQAEWKGAADPASVVRPWLGALGVNLEEHDTCMVSDRRLGRLAQATAVAQQLGVRGTPTFWVLGFGPVQGALPLEVFRQVFSSVLADVDAARSGAAPGSPDASPPN